MENIAPASALRFSARMLFQMEQKKQILGPAYDHNPNERWGDLSRGLKQCGSLRNTARKVFVELEKEGNPTAKQSSVLAKT